MKFPSLTLFNLCQKLFPDGHEKKLLRKASWSQQIYDFLAMPHFYSTGLIFTNLGLIFILVLKHFHGIFLVQFPSKTNKPLIGIRWEKKAFFYVHQKTHCGHSFIVYYKLTWSDKCFYSKRGWERHNNKEKRQDNLYSNTLPPFFCRGVSDSIFTTTYRGSSIITI